MRIGLTVEVWMGEKWIYVTECILDCLWMLPGFVVWLLSMIVVMLFMVSVVNILLLNKKISIDRFGCVFKWYTTRIFQVLVNIQ